jgi:hypothetical protein
VINLTVARVSCTCWNLQNELRIREMPASVGNRISVVQFCSQLLRMQITVAVEAGRSRVATWCYFEYQDDSLALLLKKLI